jgi:hypothetical protein
MSLYPFASHRFTNAGKTGALGPTLQDLKTEYVSAAWSQNINYLNISTQGIQIWTVPVTAVYKITCVGAHGAMGTTSTTGTRGGRGALITGKVRLTKGDKMRIIVGQAGTYTDKNGGGGGASVFSNQDGTLLFFIAGGGGGTRQAAQGNGLDASTEKWGTTSSSSSVSSSSAYNNTTHTYNGKVATEGYGGVEGEPAGYGDSGAGWLGGGKDDASASVSLATALSTTALGGTSVSSDGGFGGGGSGYGTNGGGGGGGYTGGNGGHIGGGGGSYVNPMYTFETTKAVDDSRSYTLNSTIPVHGYVLVERYAPAFSKLFTASTIYTMQIAVSNLNIFMIGGGASGFPSHSGAGGAGYILTTTHNVSVGTSISITIGAGGQRATSTPGGPAYNGGNTLVTIGNTTYNATGGVGGAGNAPGGNGSSGGGGAGNDGFGGSGGSAGSNGVSGSTYAGGTGMGITAFYSAVNPTGVLLAGAGGAAGNSSHSGGGGGGGIITDIVPYPTAENGESTLSGKGGVGFGAGGGSGGYTNTIGTYFYGGAGAPGMVYIYSPMTLATLTVAPTLSFTKKTYYTKYILNSTISIPGGTNIITTNTDSYTITHTSDNSSVATISTVSNIGTVTVKGSGKTTVTSNIAATSNFLELSVNEIIIVVVGNNTTFTNESLISIDLQQSNLSGTVFSNCDLTSANLFNSTVNSSTNFSNSNLSSIKSGRITGITTLLPEGFKMI